MASITKAKRSWEIGDGLFSLHQESTDPLTGEARHTHIGMPIDEAREMARDLGAGDAWQVLCDANARAQEKGKMDSKERKRANGLLEEQLYKAACAAAGEGNGCNADALTTALARLSPRRSSGEIVIAMVTGIAIGAAIVTAQLWGTAVDLDECQADRASLIESAGP